MKLLNLDRLTVLEQELKVRPADKAQLDRLRDRAELARRQAERPLLEAREQEVATLLGRLELHAWLLQTAQRRREVDENAAALEAAGAHEAELRERAAAAERYRAGLATLREGRAYRDRALGAEAQAALLAAELERAQRALAVEEPAILARGRALRRLKCWLDCLSALEAERVELRRAVEQADGQLAALAAGREQLNGVRQQLVAARAAERDAAAGVQELEGDERALDVRDAVREWLAARQLQARLADPDSAAGEVRARREHLGRRTRRELLLLGLAAGVLLVGALWQPLLAAGAAVALAVLAWRGWLAWRLTSELTMTLGRLEGEASVKEQERALLAEREAAAAHRLDELNAVRPADAARGQTVLDELDGRLASRTRGEIEAALRASQQQLAEARAQMASLEPREAELRATVGRTDGARLGAERDAQGARVGRIDALLARRRPRLAARAAALETADEPVAIEGELLSLRRRLADVRELAGQAPSLEQALAAGRAKAERHWADAAAAWSALPLAADLPPWSSHLTDQDWEAAAAALQAAYVQAGGDEVRRAVEEAARDVARLKERRDHLQRSLQELLDGARTRAAALKLKLGWPKAPAAADVEAAATAVGPVEDLDREALVAELERLREQVNVVRHEVRRLEQALGLAGERLDVAVTQRELDELAEALAVRERAATIVGLTSRNVVQRILPSTMEHMRHLLPKLTEDRYFDAQLSEDYRIEVYDERAKAYKMKNIFSGGTKDQLSLALRLAFALATLPEERGTAPSFLFLDEPLGAFDPERARALIHLLTEGEIAESFDQIFLISHMRVDPDLFDHRITLAAGRVVETTLDVPADGSITPSSVGAP